MAIPHLFTPKDILLLGVRGSVLAFRRDTGTQLWSTHLKSNGFVNVTSDETRVYAHTGGELFCLSLRDGVGIWHNKLPGLGYDTATLSLPGLPVAPDAILEKNRQSAAATHTAIHSSD